jgi:hypothetical protein
MIHATSSGGGAQVNPVGCLVTGSFESPAVNQGFGNHRSDAIHALPVINHLPFDLFQENSSQIVLASSVRLKIPGRKLLSH